MKSLRKTLQTLSFLPAFVGIDTTRHLTEDWPQLRRSQVEAPRPLGPQRAAKQLRTQIEEIRALTEDISSSLATSEDPSCRADSSVAIGVLKERFEKQIPSFMACEGSCRAIQAKLESYTDALRNFETQLGDCRSSQRVNRWLLERETGITGSIGAFGRRVVNDLETLTLTEDGIPPETAPLEFRSDLKLNAAYRAPKSWHSLDAKTDLVAFNGIEGEFNYSLLQQNVVQLGSQALRVGLQTSQQREWFWGYAARFNRNSLRVDGGWRGAWTTGRAIEVLGHYQDDSWGGTVWTRQTMGAETRYVLSESLHDEFRFEGGLTREVYEKDLEAPLWVTRAGLAYDRNVRSGTQASLYFGLQDRRVADQGATLWPDLRLRLEGRDLFSSSLFPSFLLKLGPEVTPWFFNTLDARATWSLSYRKSRFELPLSVSLGQAFQRGLPGELRNYRLLEVAMNARLNLSQSWSLSVPFTWTRFWVLRSQMSRAEALALYPDVAFTSSEGSVRMQYDF